VEDKLRIPTAAERKKLRLQQLLMDKKLRIQKLEVEGMEGSASWRRRNHKESSRSCRRSRR
jgi:hypothetical protein